MATSIDSQVRCDLAGETARHYGELERDFPQKMAKRLKRKFHTDLDIGTIAALANYFKKIYKFASSILHNFIMPAKEEYASLENVRIDDFIAAIVEQYPNEDRTIVKEIGDWVVYYEYLR